MNSLLISKSNFPGLKAKKLVAF